MQKKSSIFNVPVLSLADRTGTRRLAKILARGSQNAPGIEKKVVAILKDVKKRGDRAVLAHTEKYDGVRISASDLLVSKSEMEAAFECLPKPGQRRHRPKAGMARGRQGENKGSARAAGQAR